MAQQFFEARLKVEWANRHIYDLNAGINHLATQKDFYRLFVDYRSGPTLAIETGQMPAFFPLKIGDAIHALRSALDYVTSEIARRAGKDSTRIHFPFNETRDSLVTSTTYRTIKSIDTGIANIIADTIQPYEAGNFPLWALNRLDNIDKHRLLIPTLSVTSFAGVCAESSTGQKIIDCVLAATGPGRAALIGLSGEVKITNYGQPAFNVTFPKDQIFENESVVPTLKQLAELVLGVIETLEAHYFGETTK